MATKQLTNPGGAFGQDGGTSQSQYQESERFIANGAITQFEAVMIDTISDASADVTVATVAAGASNPIIGVAQETVADGEEVTVVTEGVTVCLDAAADIAAGEVLTTDATNAGELATGVAGTDHIVAYALSATGFPATGQALVWLI